METLVSGLAHKDPKVRSTISDLITGSIGVMTHAVISALSNPSVEVRWRSAEILGRCKVVEAVEMLGKIMLADEEDNVREACKWAIENIGGSEAQEYIGRYKSLSAARHNMALRGVAANRFVEQSRTVPKQAAVQGSVRKPCQSKEAGRLVAMLVSNDEPTFLDGFRQAVSFAPKGDPTGLEAMKEAIRRRSGQHNAILYEPRSGVLIASGSYVSNARRRLLRLARKKRLLRDPYETGKLISAFLFINDREGLDDLLQEIFAVGGAEQGYVFQLLFNQMRAFAELAKANRS